MAAPMENHTLTEKEADNEIEHVAAIAAGAEMLTHSLLPSNLVSIKFGPFQLSSVQEHDAAVKFQCSSSSMVSTSALPLSSIPNAHVMQPLLTTSFPEISHVMAPQAPPTEVLAEANEERGKRVIEPEVGMCFESADAAYNMYNSYARKLGFSVRKHDTRRRGDKTIYQKVIVCSNEGIRGTHSSHETLKENDTTRTDCKACTGANMIVPSIANSHMYVDFSSLDGPFMRRGYTSLLLGVDQDASAARKLQFQEAGNHTTIDTALMNLKEP